MNVNASQIEQAVSQLRQGELVAFATETVYGLGADAESSRGVAQIYQRKGRPAGHPLIVHVASQASACFWIQWNVMGSALAGAFWPGPLTLIATRNNEAAGYACGDEVTVGLRCPSHPLAQTLLQAFEKNGGHGIAAPSANLFGGVSPTRASHVRDDFGDDLLILDGGDSQVGLESTIVDVSRGYATILRPGAVTALQINDALTARGLNPLDSTSAGQTDTPKVAGSLAAHYAPKSALLLVSPTEVAVRVKQFAASGKSVAVCSATRPAGAMHWEKASPDPTVFGQRLYALLREFDQMAIDQIVIEQPTNTEDWSAIHDRLGRAQTGSG